MSDTDLDAEIEQMLFDSYYHLMPQQHMCTTVSALIAQGRPVATTCGLSSWMPRVWSDQETLCPACKGMLDGGKIKTIIGEVPLLPDWWLRLTGRLPKR